MNTKTKKDYVDLCKSDFDKINRTRKILVRYNRNKKNQKNGVVVAYKDDNDRVVVGISKCNTSSGDVFNKYVGLSKAIKEAAPIEEYYNNPSRQVSVPASMSDVVNHQLNKIRKYFRV